MAEDIIELNGSGSSVGSIRVRLDIELPHDEAMQILQTVQGYKARLLKEQEAAARKADAERRKAEAEARKAAKTEAAKAKKAGAAKADKTAEPGAKSGAA